jgi:hypothetical protein
MEHLIGKLPSISTASKKVSKNPKDNLLAQSPQDLLRIAGLVLENGLGSYNHGHPCIHASPIWLRNHQLPI